MDGTKEGRKEGRQYAVTTRSCIWYLVFGDVWCLEPHLGF